RINEAAMHLSPCIRCDTCDGYPCLVGAKSDAEVSAVRPALTRALHTCGSRRREEADAFSVRSTPPPHGGGYTEPNLTLITEAKVLRLHTNASGRQITGVVTEVKGEQRMFSADVVVVSCGAVNSSALLLRSANDKHPNGLGNNSSGLLGRNLMKH